MMRRKDEKKDGGMGSSLQECKKYLKRNVGVKLKGKR